MNIYIVINILILIIAPFLNFAFASPHEYKGFYVGLNGGKQISKVNSNNTVHIFIPNVENIIVSNNPHINYSSGLGGVVLGASTLFAKRGFVGIEGRADLERVRAVNTRLFTEEFSDFLLTSLRTVSLNNDYTLVLKPGILSISSGTLFYAVGGATLANVSIITDVALSQNIGVLLSADKSLSYSKNKVAYVFGLGIEQIIRHNLHVKIEFDYIDYGAILSNQSGQTNVNFDGVPNSDTFYNVKNNYVTLVMNKVMLGLVYYFYC